MPSKKDIDEAVKRATRAMMAEYGTTVFDGPHLTTIVRAATQGMLTDVEAKQIRDTAMADLREKHAEIIAEKYEKGKERMRVKYAALHEATDDLREARDFVMNAISWSGTAQWKQQVIDRLNEAIRKYDPAGP